MAGKSQAVTNYGRQQSETQQEEVYTLRIRQFLRINPPSFTGSSSTEDPKNIVEKSKKVFDVMYVIDVEWVELDAYQLKNLSRFFLISWIRIKIRMHHAWVGMKQDLTLKQVYFIVDDMRWS